MKRLLASLLLLVVGACADSTSEGIYHVSMTEFEITTSAERARAGTFDLTLANDGSMPHTLVVADQTGEVLTATDPIEPGTEQLLTIELPPGRYQLTCRIVFRGDDGVLVDHFQRGMAASVTLTG